MKKGNIRVIFLIPFLILSQIENVISDEIIKGKQKFLIRMGTLAPEGTSWIKMWEKVKEYIENESSGKVKIITYTSGVMGDEPVMIEKLKKKELEIAGVTVGGISNIAPEMLVLSLPFLFNDFNEVNFIRQEMLMTFSKIFENKGFMLLAWIDQGFVNFYTDTPVSKIDDFKNLKSWAWAAEPTGEWTFKAMGIPYIKGQVLDVLDWIKSKRISMFYTTPLACIALQWCYHTKYLIHLNIRYEPAIIVETKEYWDSMPEEIKLITKKAISNFITDVINYTQWEQARAFSVLLEKGIKIIRFKEEEINELKLLTRTVWDELKDTVYPSSLLEEIKSKLNDYRIKNKK